MRLSVSKASLALAGSLGARLPTDATPIRSLPGVPRRIVRSPQGVPSVDRRGEAQPLLSAKTDGRSPRLATMVMRENLASPLMDNAVRQVPPAPSRAPSVRRQTNPIRRMRRPKPTAVASTEPKGASPTEANGNAPTEAKFAQNKANTPVAGTPAESGPPGLLPDSPSPRRRPTTAKHVRSLAHPLWGLEWSHALGAPDWIAPGFAPHRARDEGGRFQSDAGFAMMISDPRTLRGTTQWLSSLWNGP